MKFLNDPTVQRDCAWLRKLQCFLLDQLPGVQVLHKKTINPKWMGANGSHMRSPWILSSAGAFMGTHSFTMSRFQTFGEEGWSQNRRSKDPKVVKGKLTNYHQLRWLAKRPWLLLIMPPCKCLSPVPIQQEIEYFKLGGLQTNVLHLHLPFILRLYLILL